jgi:hypothetical protein
LHGFECNRLLQTVTSGLPVIRPESRPKDEITFYQPTSHY